jgi:hypothetical protein
VCRNGRRPLVSGDALRAIVRSRCVITTIRSSPSTPFVFTTREAVAAVLSRPGPVTTLATAGSRRAPNAARPNDDEHSSDIDT